ncbi:MAG: hypothetical protein IKX51_01625 [Bacteroidales bacterium]|nr:hypothetical protein [Bacteroidales bacterium]
MHEIFDKYIKVPEGVAKRLGIRGTEAFVFFCVLNYTSSKDGCIMTKEQMADCLNVSGDAINRAKTSLKGKGYIVPDPRRKQKGEGYSYRVSKLAMEFIEGKRLPNPKQAKHKPPINRSFDCPKIGQTNGWIDCPKIGQQNEAKSGEADCPILPLGLSENRTINKYNINYIGDKEEIYSDSIDVSSNSYVTSTTLPPPEGVIFPSASEQYEHLRSEWCQSMTNCGKSLEEYERAKGIVPTYYKNFSDLRHDFGEEAALSALWAASRNPMLLEGEKWEQEGLKKIILQHQNKTTKQ